MRRSRLELAGDYLWPVLSPKFLGIDDVVERGLSGPDHRVFVSMDGECLRLRMIAKPNVCKHDCASNEIVQGTELILQFLHGIDEALMAPGTFLVVVERGEELCRVAKFFVSLRA